MTSNGRNLRHRRAGATEMDDRSAPQVHVEKATLDAVLAGNLIDSGLGADLGEPRPRALGF
jgi:hypothetical protein